MPTTKSLPAVDRGAATVVEAADGVALSAFASAVSLHAHTNRSREVMTPVRPYLERIPLVGSLVRREMRAYEQRNGSPVDFSKGWWHPPLDPHEVFASEVAQIETRLGLRPIVSITDHDSIDACLALRATLAAPIPVSVEWTAPFQRNYVHFGVHNLPSGSAYELFRTLAAFTAKPADGWLGELLRQLHAHKDVLIVLNHPLWDLKGVGAAEHGALIRSLVSAHGGYIHALEVNGYRSWRENVAVMQLAAACGLPVVSGGDRHGCAPNGLLNVTTATTFAGFVAEVREQHESTVLVMPEYRHSLIDRKIRVAVDAMRDYPLRPKGQQRWTERVYYERGGTVRSIADKWPTGGPLWIRCAMQAFELGASDPLLPLLRTVASLAGASTSDRDDTFPEEVPVAKRVAAAGASVAETVR